MRPEDRPRPRRGAASDLERYAGLFASRTKVMTSSAMRDLMAITERPEVISLAGGLPDTTAFPRERLASILSKVAAADGPRALQYGPTEGILGCREAIAEVMAAEGTVVDPGDVLVTTGGQQVIELVCKTLVDPGDVVVAEAPTYPGAVPTFSAYQADVVQVEMDDDGMVIEALEACLERLDREGRVPKFIYTIPNFHNPAGVTMALDRRRRLVELANERRLLVLEDNPYGLLRFEGEPLPTLRSLDDGDLVISLGTFSKILSPGLRLGWAVAPGPVMQKMVVGKQGGDLCSSTLSQVFVEHLFREGGWREHVDVQIALYRRRRDVMLRALDDFMPAGSAWTRPQGGLFLWATLPDFLDTTDLLARALGRDVAFVPGRAAFLDGRGATSMRLNFSAVDDEDIREGVRRIGEVVAEQVGLFGSMTGAFPAVAAPGEDTGDEPSNVRELPRRRAS